MRAMLYFHIENLLLSRWFSGMANRAGWEVMLAILAHPEVGGKSEDDQTKD